MFNKIEFIEDCNDLLMYRKYEKFIQLFNLQAKKKDKLPVVCKISNCFGKHVAKNFCAKHYYIYKKK